MGMRPKAVSKAILPLNHLGHLIRKYFVTLCREVLVRSLTWAA